MTHGWAMKALGAMTSEELLAALEGLAYTAPHDAALAKALSGELARAFWEEGEGWPVLTPSRT